MRRYAFTDNIHKLEKHYFDVIIIGSGIAGLYTALHLDQKCSCAVLSKSSMEIGASWLAQGGIASVTLDEDCTELHIQDTLAAGAGLCDENAVKVLVEEGPQDIQKLLSLNVQFDVDQFGDFQITKEGGHSKRRILHSNGDGTGKEIIEKLTQLAQCRENIHLMQNIYLMDILTSDKRVSGVLTYDGQYRIFIASNIVVCTGGIGQVYKNSTNPPGATGDGIAAAIRAGARVMDMEFVQFHPTALFEPQHTGQFFLISEAVRGEGGILRNHNGDRFMPAIHPMAELAPRDIVSRAIVYEMNQHNTSHVFLDITAKSKEYLAARFPTIYNHCIKRGIDIAAQWIPVAPVQHYFMGGIKTDLYGLTNIQGLYACGEAACTNVHGANRLASNSLLDCLVFGRRCAQHINGSWQRHFSFGFEANQIACDTKMNDFEEFRSIIQNIMMKNAGIIRNEKGLLDALNQLKNLQCLVEKVCLCDPVHVETYNMIIVAMHIVEASLQRKESVGAHFREDISYKGGIKAC